MEGSRKERVTSARVAVNLQRIMRARGLSYAELSRRLAAGGHPVADTGLLKAVKGDRRIGVDELVALAVALGVPPNALLFPGTDDGTPVPLTPGGEAGYREAWAWASGESPLGHPAASAGTPRETRMAEVAFSREGRPHHWNVPAPPRPANRDAAVARLLAVTGISAFVLEAFRAGLSTADIRDTVEGALSAALVVADPASMSVRVEAAEGKLTVWTSEPGGEAEAAP